MGGRNKDIKRGTEWSRCVRQAQQQQLTHRATLTSSGRGVNCRLPAFICVLEEEDGRRTGGRWEEDERMMGGRCEYL